MTILFALAVYVVFFAPTALVVLMSLALFACTVTAHGAAADKAAEAPPLPPARVVTR